MLPYPGGITPTAQYPSEGTKGYLLQFSGELKILVHKSKHGMESSHELSMFRNVDISAQPFNSLAKSEEVCFCLEPCVVSNAPFLASQMLVSVSVQ